MALHLGPDEWWLIVPAAEGEAVAAQLTKALAGQPHSLVDVSHRQVGYVLQGAGAAGLLNAGCPLDLAEAAFPIGTATRSLFNRVGVMIWRMGPELFRLEVDRSLAPYFVAALAEAAHDHEGWPNNRAGPDRFSGEGGAVPGFAGPGRGVEKRQHGAWRGSAWRQR